MRIAVRTYGSEGDQVNGFGGGEQRWTANLAHFLRSEGHEVIRCNEGQDAGCDVFFDASWERCQHVRSPKHVHFSFFGPNPGAKEISECVRSGNCNLAGPYRTAYNNLLKWAKVEKHNSFFVPQPYPDDLMPAPAREVRGFERNEIFWGTKDNFHPVFDPQRDPNTGREHVFIENGLNTLRALIRFQDKVPFKMHFLLKHHLDQAPARLGVPALLDQIKDKQFYTVVPWQPLVGILSRCKLNVPVGGLWGSIPETIFTNGYPLIYPQNQFSDDFGSIMPLVREVTEDEVYDAINTLWFDEKIYERNRELLNDLFKDHRTEGLRRNLKIVFEKLGL